MITLLATTDVTSMTVAIVQDQQQLRKATPAWLDLLDRGTVGHNVHNDPRMILFTLEARPSLQPRILLISQGDGLACVAPFYVQPAQFSFDFSVWRLLSLRARELRIFGESVVLASDVDAESCVTLVGDFLRTMAPSIDYLQVYGMNYSEVFWKAVLRDNALSGRSGWAFLPMRKEKLHQVLMKNTFDEYIATLNAGTRQTLRRTRRRFFEVAGTRIDKFTGQRDVSRLLQLMDGVYRNSWQRKTFGDVCRNGFAQQTLLAQVAAEGWLRSYVLMRDDHPVAFQHGFQYRNVYYGQESAFHQQYSSAGPGAVLSFCVLEDLHTENPAVAWDFGFGDLQYKRSFGSVEHDAAIVYFVPRNRWRIILRLQQLLNSVYEGARTTLVRLRIDRFVRKLVKRQK